MSFLINIVAGVQLKPIFIQKQAPALVFSWQLSEIFNNDFFNTLINFEKKHCYNCGATLSNIIHIFIVLQNINITTLKIKLLIQKHTIFISSAHKIHNIIWLWLKKNRTETGVDQTTRRR